MGMNLHKIVAEELRDELEALATNFEGAGPQAVWTGEQIAWHIRERIKNHPDIAPHLDLVGSAPPRGAASQGGDK